MTRGPGEPALAGAAFTRAFPFHLVLDDALRVIGIGPSLRKACPWLQTGTAMAGQFRISRPRAAATFEAWRSHVGELCTLHGLGPEPITLRGSAELGDDGTLLLLLSPVLQTMDDMQRLGLQFSDFARHDATGDVSLLMQTARMSSADAQRLAERLRSRSEQLTATLELSRNGFAYFDRQGLLLHVNSALLQMLGIARVSAFDLDIRRFDEWIGQRLAPEESQRSPLSTLMRSSTPHAELTLRLVDPKPTVVHITHASTQDGSVVFYLRDVTRESEVDRMKSEFLSTAAHELRTPMVSVFGFTELLLHRPVPEDRSREVLQTIHRQSSLLIGMINDLLDLARIESRQGQDLRREPVEVARMVDDTLRRLAGATGGHSLQVQLEPAHRNCCVQVDPAKTSQALTNVLSNAMKYSPAGSVVRLTSLSGDGLLGIRVCDQGIGMSTDQLARIFERFYRADPSGSVPGTGLGMSLVKEIIELQQGRVDVHSAPGAGTQVTLWLPLSAAWPSAEGQATQPSAHAQYPQGPAPA